MYDYGYWNVITIKILFLNSFLIIYFLSSIYPVSIIICTKHKQNPNILLGCRNRLFGFWNKNTKNVLQRNPIRSAVRKQTFLFLEVKGRKTFTWQNRITSRFHRKPYETRLHLKTMKAWFSWYKWIHKVNFKC